MSKRPSKNKRYIVSVVEVIGSTPSISTINSDNTDVVELRALETTQIYSQNVKILDLAEVIKAVNK